MGNYNVYLPNYSVGAGCYSEIPKVARRLGNKAIVIGGRTAIDKAKQALLDGISGSDMKIIDFIVYGDDSTYENVDKLVNDERVKNADIIFGVGGGRAVDTTKVVADKLDKPLFTFPTLGSNCAAVTAICVMYNEDHTFKEYYYLEGPADHTFIDTQIIAESPEDLFWAGIGDALSKECEAVYSSEGVNLGHTPLMGVGVSKICTDPLIKYGKKALEDCKNNQDSEELKQETKNKKTGKSKEAYTLTFYGKEYKLIRNIKYKDYIIENKTKEIKLGNYTFPLKIVVSTFFEVEKEEVEVNKDKLKESLKQKALKDLYYMMPASAKIEDVNYQHKVSKNMLEYIVTVQASEDISKVYSLNQQEINKILEENSKSEDGESVPSNPQKRPIDDIKNKYEQNNKKDDTKDTTENN